MKTTGRKVWSSILTLVLLFSALPMGIPVLAASKMTLKDGAFSIEAEKVTVNSTFTEVEDTAMSGGKGLNTTGKVDAAPAKTQKGELEFSFTPDKAAKYNFWARLNPTNLNKTVWISLGGGDYTSVKLKGVANELSWVNLCEITTAKAGEDMLIRIITQNGYFKFDKFIVTSDMTLIPEGLGTVSAVKPTATPSSATAAAGKEVVFETKDGFAKFEAENVKINDAYTSITGDGLSGGKGLTTEVGRDGKFTLTDPADIEFSFKADVAGNYVVWGRTKPTSASKSMGVSVNQGEYKSTNLGGTPGEYHWFTVAKAANLKAGDVISIRMRTINGYFDLDNFVIVNKSNVTPEGKEGELVEKDSKLPDNLYPTPSFTPPPEHPRLYFTKKDLPQILANAQKPQNAAAWTQHQANLQKQENGTLPLPKAGTGNTDNNVLGIFESWAFDYVTGGSAELGKKAIAGIQNYINTLVLIEPNNDPYTRNAGHAIFTLAEIYDWCYPLLTNDDKNNMIELSENLIANGIEVGWPPTGQGSVTSHGSEAQILRDLNSFAIAVYDERPDIYNVVVGRFFADYVPARTFANQSHMFHQGTGYGSYRGQWDFNATWIFDRMGLPRVFGDDQQYTPYWFLYARRPDGQLLREGDYNTNGSEIGIYANNAARMMTLAANYYNDPYLKKEAARQNTNFSYFKYGHGNMSPVEFLVFNNPELEGEPASELPLTKYFPAPMGQMIARTDWADGITAPTAIAQMKVDEIWFANHDHLDAGHFQLYYKGLLTGDTGRYESYGTEHDFIYNKNTIAHNTMLILDPNEDMTYSKFNINVGGQNPINKGGEVSHISTFLTPDDPHHIGKVEGHEFGPDPMKPEYTYLKGDITKAYSTKVKDYDRSFMFLNLNDQEHPAAMLVFDRVISSNKDFKKTWLLHGMYEPEIKGNQTVFRNDKYGYNGKLTVDTLLPTADNTVIEKVGGEGKEFWVKDKNYPGSAAIKEGSVKESDGWRMELSPKTPSAVDYFFNVLQVGDATPDTPPLPLTDISTDKVAGVQIADRVVVFSKQNGRTKDAVEFTVTGDKTYKILVADVEKGTWKIQKDGADPGSAAATDEGGLLGFEGGAGTYKLTYSSDSIIGRVDIAPMVAPQEGIEIRIDKKYLYTDVPATVRNDRTLVPMRAIFEALKAEITWDEATSTVTGVRDGTTVKLTIDSDVAMVNGKEVALDVAPTLVNNRTMVPIRFVSESLNAKVDWDPFAQCVYITSPPKAGAATGGNYPPLMGVPNSLPVFEITQSDSDGNDIKNTLDGDLGTRWAVEGTEKYAWGIYDLGAVKTLDAVCLAFYNGNTRVYTFSIEVSEDGQNYTRILNQQVTSGKTLELETYKLNGVKARYVKYFGGGNTTNMWNSMTEIAFVEKK